MAFCMWANGQNCCFIAEMKSVHDKIILPYLLISSFVLASHQTSVAPSIFNEANSISVSSSPSSSVHQPYKSKNTGKKPFLKLDVKFELPMFDGEVNAENLDNWIRQLEVYLRIQNFYDDDTKIQLASLRMEGETLVWREAKTKEEINKHGKIILSWTDFINAIKIQFYLLAHMQKSIMN